VEDLPVVYDPDHPEISRSMTPPTDDAPLTRNEAVVGSLLRLYKRLRRQPVAETWVPPTPPPSVGWRRWAPALISGLAAGAVTFELLGSWDTFQRFALHYTRTFLGVSLPIWIALLAVWTVGTGITGLTAQARTKREWLLAFALVTGASIALTLAFWGFLVGGITLLENEWSR